jgi:hypothetical protein
VSIARTQVRPKLRKILEVVIPFRRVRHAYQPTSGGSGTNFRAEDADQAIIVRRPEDVEDDQDDDGVDGDVEMNENDMVSSVRE